MRCCRLRSTVVTGANRIRIIHGDIRNCLLFYNLIPKNKECRMRWSELRTEMPMEGLRSVISSTCIRRNLRPKRGREDGSSDVGEQDIISKANASETSFGCKNDRVTDRRINVASGLLHFQICNTLYVAPQCLTKMEPACISCDRWKHRTKCIL